MAKTSAKNPATTSPKGRKPRALKGPRKAGADDLTVIKGIGPKIHGQLNGMGIYHYDQIAKWLKPECEWVNTHLKFKGRIEREQWVQQAKALVKHGEKTSQSASKKETTAGNKKQKTAASTSSISKKAAAKKSTTSKPAKVDTKMGESRPVNPQSQKQSDSDSESKQKISGYGMGKVDAVISVEAVTREVAKISDGVPTKSELDALANNDPILQIEKLRAGYGQMEILHDFELSVAQGQSLCLIGPNGAGKSTVLHSIFGFTNIYSGSIRIGGLDVTAQKPNEKLKNSGIAYILQDNSVFPNMTVEENLWMGGYLKDQPHEAKEAAERVFEKYDRLAKRRNQPARVLSGGERRLLEISRALVMNPQVLLVDEPSIGLEPRFIDMVFEILDDLQNRDGKTIIMVEQNAKKGLEFADIGYVLVSGQIAKAGKGSELLDDPDVGRLFLGG